MRHPCEQLVESARYLDSAGLSRQQLSQLHHRSRRGGTGGFAATMPPSPFALLVAKAVGDLSPASEWRALTGPNVDEPVREAMRQSYAEIVLPKFVRRYGFSWPPIEEERRMIRWL